MRSDAAFFYNIKEVAEMFSRVMAMRGIQFDLTNHVYCLALGISC